MLYLQYCGRAFLLSSFAMVGWHMGVVIAKAMGTSVTITTTKEDEWADAMALGADAVLISENKDEMVINNLVPKNAIKYSPEQERIEIFLSIVGDYIKVSLTDQGLGIGIDEQTKIFNRFYRVNEIQQKYPGMSIGLYVCQHIIKNHHGTLWVDSEKGKGSTFSFILPLTTKNN